MSVVESKTATHPRILRRRIGQVSPERTAALARLFGRDGLLWAALLAPLAAGTILRLLSGPLIDPDYWWHLATGRWILDHSRVPTVDPFSFSHGGQNWYAHEWLAETALALADRVAGYAGAILLTAAIVGAAVWLLWRTARLYGAGTRTAFAATVLSGCFLVNYFAVRPQVWGFALLALLLHELAAHDTGRRPWLWHLPLLFALWINVHLSALTGGGVMVLYAAHRLVRWQVAGQASRVQERARFLQTFTAGALSALALCVNPRGPALLWFTRVYLAPGAARYRYIQEWQPPKPTPLNLVLLAVGLALVGCSIVAIIRRKSLWPALPAVVLAPLALHAARYIPVLGIATAPTAAWLLTQAAASRKSTAPPLATRSFGFVLAGLTIACGLFAALAGGGQFHRTPDAVASNYPVAAADWVRANLPGARLFNDYDWGGYLIATLYPSAQVNIDGREEMYGEQFLIRYLDAAHLRPGWRETLATSGAGVVITDRTGALAAALATDSGWQLRFQDRVADVFVPVGEFREYIARSCGTKRLQCRFRPYRCSYDFLY